MGRVASVLAMLMAAPALAQTPQPFPRPAAPQTQAPAPATPARPTPPPAPAPTAPTTTTAGNPRPAGAPDPAALGVPLYPDAQFIASYDAGRGQRYYLYGSASAFAELVMFYRTQLKERGNLVFEEPPAHMFEVGRFRDETMAFPPSVTIRDWTWGGSQGYPNPRPGTQPSRFVSVIMVVPPPPGTTP